MKFNERVEQIMELLDTKTELTKDRNVNKREQFNYRVKIGDINLKFIGDYQSNGHWIGEFAFAYTVKNNNKISQFFSWLFRSEWDYLRDKNKYSDFETYDEWDKPTFIQILNGFKSVFEQFVKDKPNSELYVEIPDVGQNNDMLKMIKKLVTKIKVKGADVSFSKNEGAIVVKAK